SIDAPRPRSRRTSRLSVRWTSRSCRPPTRLPPTPCRCCPPRTPCATAPCRCSCSLCLLFLSGSVSPLLSDAFDRLAPPGHRVDDPTYPCQGAPSIVTSTAGNAVPKILIVGGGYAGFYTAWK